MSMTRNEILVALLVEDGNDPKSIGASAYAKALVERKQAEAWQTERRDRTGKWTDTGGGGAPPRESYREFVARTRAEAAAAVATPVSRRTMARNKPAPRSQFLDSQVKDMQKAANDAVRRHPALTKGRHPLLGIAFATGNKPRDESSRTWDAARMRMAADRADALASFVPDEGTLIIINDTMAMRGESLNNPHLNVPAVNTAYGIATHEVGHAFYNAHGYNGSGAAEQLLARHGISPSDLIGYSDYGAASPAEALAELYAQAHTPGHSLPPVLAQKYQRLEAYASAHPAGGAQGTVSPLLTSDPKLNRQIQEAAARNAQADKWIVRVPILDGRD